MATVRLQIRESRTTTVEFEVDEALLADPDEHRCNTLQAMLHQPAEAALSGRTVEWSQPRLKIISAQGDYQGTTYEERAR